MLAIHERKGSFSDKWIEFCKKNDIEFKIVNCYSNNIVYDIKDCDALLWHWANWKREDKLIAYDIIKSIEYSGVRVFPNSNTCWHYDNKIAQKYLLDSLDLPSIGTHIFVHRSTAEKWVNEANFPKVFKASSGAGSMSVELVTSRSKAIKLIKKSFSGNLYLPTKNRVLVENWWNLKSKGDIKSFLKVAKSILLYLIPDRLFTKRDSVNRYVYFQDYIKNDYDTRIVIIGNKCLAVRRDNRDNDFRASGSGKLSYDPDLIDSRMINLAFEFCEKTEAQIMGFDFLYDSNGKPVICEMSYGFPTGAFLENCKGYWDRDLNWHDQYIQPEYEMLRIVTNK